MTLAAQPLKRLAFCSLFAADAAIRNWRPDCIVSAFSPRRPVQALRGWRHLRLGFHDVEQPTRGRTLISADQVAAFFAFVEASEGGSLLIHCSLGLSRAPALAIVAAIMAGLPLARMLDELAPLASVLRPNRLILAHASARLGIGSTLIEAAMVTFASGYASPAYVALPAWVELPVSGATPQAGLR